MFDMILSFNGFNQDQWVEQQAKKIPPGCWVRDL